MPSSPNLPSGHSISNGCIQQNNIVYRTNSVSTCTTGAESLPPSPQSQHSCFNSPQGSPGPISISPQDLNPFTSNNSYDIMQKKFDSINLETSQSFKGYPGHMYGQYSPVSALSPTSPTGPSQGLVLNSRSTNNTNNLPMHGKLKGINGSNANMESLNCNKNDKNNDNLLNHKNSSVVSPSIHSSIPNDKNIKDNSINCKLDLSNLDEMGVRNNKINCNNNNNNNDTSLIEFDQYNQNIMHHHLIQHQSSNDLTNGTNKTNTDNQISNLMNKTHKNSIPNIIFTFSGSYIF